MRGRGRTGGNLLRAMAGSSAAWTDQPLFDVYRFRFVDREPGQRGDDHRVEFASPTQRRKLAPGGDAVGGKRLYISDGFVDLGVLAVAAKLLEGAHTAASLAGAGVHSRQRAV